MKSIKKVFSNALLQSFWMFLVLTFLVSAPLAHGRVSRVTVAVDGMSCPFCAFGVEKKLKKVKGVESVAIDLKSGMATLSAKEGKTIHVDQVPGAIKAAGFTPGTIHLTAVGTISMNEQRHLMVRVHGSQQTFFLVNLKENIKGLIETLAKTGNLAEVAGNFHTHVDNMPSITLENIEEVTK